MECLSLHLLITAITGSRSAETSAGTMQICDRKTHSEESDFAQFKPSLKNNYRAFKVLCQSAEWTT